MKRILVSVLSLIFSAAASAQTVTHPVIVPDIPGYVTMKGDMHLHTVFSDGTVWPTTRVEEAILEGLDFIAITDHVEVGLTKRIRDGLFNCDRNKSFEIARDFAKNRGVIVIHGGEITRGMPPGHFNATFVNDCEALSAASASSKNHFEGMTAALKEARRQGAFLVWNHPHWNRQAPNETVWHPEHSDIYEAGLMDGIEIFNHCDGYSPEAHHWAVEKGLTIVSGTDAHTMLASRVDYVHGAFRPMNLVFATARSEEAIYGALKEGRNAVFAEGKVYGDARFLVPLVDEILKIVSVTRSPKGVSIRIHNGSSIPVQLEKSGSTAYGYIRSITVLPGSDCTINVIPLDKGTKMDDSFSIGFKVMNFFVDAGVPLDYTLKVK
ncbi:MAG: CehA/McbA family metallohydrolase [Bacteroidales bacterium]|nr:CehA/McbA family metallohydrolase [Bacteroidales bacterium]